MKRNGHAISVLWAILLTACNNTSNKSVSPALSITNEQARIVAQIDSSFRLKKDSVNKHYDSVIHKTVLTDIQKDSVKQAKKKSQMELKLQENEALSKILDAEQLVAYQLQKEKKQESVEEKIAKKVAKLKEEYSLTDNQLKLVQPIVIKAETEKDAIKKKYLMEGRDKTEEMKKEEKAAIEKVDMVFSQSLQKIFTPEQNEKLQTKLDEKKKKKMEKKD